MKLAIPKVGMRTIKTAVAVMLSYLVFVPFDLMYTSEYGGVLGQIGPLYSCIACVVCMQSSLGQTVHQGISRFLGVLIGGVLGGLTLFLGDLLDHPAIKVLVLGLTSVLGIWISLLIRRPAACGMSCIVPCVMLIAANATGADRYYYAAARVIETAVGVGVALAVNALLPDHRQEEKPPEEPTEQEPQK